MEPPLKQPAMSSAKQTNSLDDLPDDIIHKILNFFTIKDIARFSTLSKRCRKLSITIPNLYISLTREKINGFSRRTRFVDFIDRFMIFRNGMKLQKFKVTWVFDTNPHARLHNEEYRIKSWLYQAARCNVEELDLRVRFQENNRVFSLPLCFTECNSFKYLNIELFDGTLKLPSVGFKFLQVVTLRDTRVQQHGFEHWLSNCESLRRLNICNIKVLMEDVR